MRQHLAKLAPAFLVGGCSLIYNPNNIEKPPADARIDGDDTDAPIDAPPIFDANPSMLSLETLKPGKLYEGQGIAGSRPALLVIRGHHIVPTGLTVTITPADDLTIGTPQAANNGDFIAVPVTVALNTGMSTGTVALTVTVEQTGGPGPVMLTDKLMLEYLPELTTGTTINTSALAPLYSQVDLGNVTFTGTGPAILKATSSIKIGNITANGGNGGTVDTVGTAGPGGCAGGPRMMNGGCAGFDGRGLGGINNAGGGGGGYGTTGDNGIGNADSGGAAHGNAQIVNYVTTPSETNRSAGGGGGASSGLGNAGAGGGGGGTVELTAGGDIMTGTISANGGNGGAATGLTAAGGGGGGSGGVVVVRSAAGTVTSGAISATGGDAGGGAAGGGAGGAGGVGRIRIDGPGTLPTSTPPAHRGHSYATGTMQVFTDVSPMITMVGASNDEIDGYVIDMDDMLRTGEPMDKVFVDGMVALMPTLIPGYNKLCFTLVPGTRGGDLADSCIEIAYLP